MARSGGLAGRKSLAPFLSEETTMAYLDLDERYIGMDLWDGFCILADDYLWRLGIRTQEQEESHGFFWSGIANHLIVENAMGITGNIDSSL
jgi:hypothetical protein